MFQQLLCSLLIYVDSLNKSLDYIFFSINNIKIYIRIYNRWSLYRLLSSNAGNSNNVLNANSDGNLYGDVIWFSYGVRPVVYLKSNIKIADGTGEAGSPYTLEEIQ